MTASHLAFIPDDLQSVISQVELKTGISVDFSKNTDAIKREFPAIGKSAAILDIDPDRQKISIWLGEAAVAPHTIGHELIHLRRSIIEACPKMFPTNDCPPEVAQEIFFSENDLEHFFVIQEEISKFSDAKDFWISHYKERLRLSSLSEKDTIMHWCLLRTLFLEHSEELVRSCANNLHAFKNDKLLKFANNLQIELSHAFPDKRKMIDLHLEFFPNIRENVIIGKYVAENGILSGSPFIDS